MAWLTLGMILCVFFGGMGVAIVIGCALILLTLWITGVI
jgi:hypothetical protein